MRTLSQLSFVLLATFLVTFVFVPIIPLANRGYRSGEKQEALITCRKTTADFEAILGPPGDYRVDRTSDMFYWNPGEIQYQKARMCDGPTTILRYGLALAP
jgi:hypothetical protein